MQIKVDEDLPPIVAHRLHAHGYDAKTVLEQGMGGWKDPQIWKAIQKEGRFLVTADKGFADIRQHPPGTHHGVLLLRPDEDGIRPMLALLESVLNTIDLNQLESTIAVVTSRGLRVRRAIE